MRRAMLAVLSAAAGTSLLVGLKAHFTAPTVPAAQAGTNPAAGDKSTEPAAPGKSGAPSSGAPPAAGGNNGGGNNAGGGAQAQTIDGTKVNTPYGPVVVTIKVSGGKITDIDAVVPSTGESATISPPAAAKLKAQALQRQNAKLDTVSGATYTSDAYKKSLQAAIDQIKRG
ncbi:hypothetical protein Val02_44800 [Virgisporangium aliadipatigenens]|uniref:FMN-binding domain-containing protein n=1 Tax=Virgisporangium aliadipatigenens TaxID=741659 RepID=A0A8J3YLC2_9ACTN|nr:FMN-binding protein [Virgisporangium aliadipatigenens]GIJ47594.1 hypothetical protein Val02_44800 [Virgisporangium aliadipatigenens]